MVFKNREEAALLLSRKMLKYKNSNSVVLAVPRGGLPVGDVLARELELTLDVVLAKKIGHPINSEYAVGCVTMDDVFIGNHPDVSPEYFQNESVRIQSILKEKYNLYRNGKSPVIIKGKNVIITDDGIATGETLKACIDSVKRRLPEKIVVAVPVAPKSTADLFRRMTDEFICLFESDDFRGVGQFYQDFSQVSDFEAQEILNKRMK